MTDIRTARERFDRFKAEWDERKKIEFHEASALHRLAVYQAVWDAKDAGKSVAQICREYGTKDRRTILNILASRESMGFGGAIDGDESIYIEPVENADGYPNTHRVTVRNYGDQHYTGSVVVYPSSDGVRFVPGTIDDIGGPLQSEIIKWNDASEVVRQIREVLGL